MKFAPQIRTQMLDEAPLHFHTRAAGKLLLTGEYFVLDGAEALAIPVRFGQTLTAEPIQVGYLHWQSLNHDGSLWFEGIFDLPSLTPLRSTDAGTTSTLQQILQQCQRQNPHFLTGKQGFSVKTQNDFPREWGLGTSSTLIAALGHWAQADPYQLLFATMGGSGYDIAAAYAQGAFLYRLEQQLPTIQPIPFAPSFLDNLYFVFLGKKQNSREGIQRYRALAKDKPDLKEQITALTHRFLSAEKLETAEQVILEHEQLIAEILDLPRAKDLYFADFWGEIKSLGAWGGDFVLATSHKSATETKAYFQEKGFEVLFSYPEMA